MERPMLSEYQRVRDESNKVAEQQARNLEEINKVLEAYQKARAEILETHKKAVEDIKNKSKMEE
jgi:septation ring formation regulator EzrA